MSIKITRDTGWMATLPKIKLFLDGEEVARISQNETIELDLKDSSSIFQAKQLGLKSEKIKVKDGDNLVIRPDKYGFKFFLGFLFTIFIANIFIRKIFFIVMVTLIYILVYYMNNNFEVEKI